MDTEIPSREEDASPGSPTSPTKLIAYSEIEHLLQRHCFLEKPVIIDRAIQECNVPEDMMRELARGGRRDRLHLIRLLRRSVTERNFALAYLRHSRDIFAEDDESAEAIKDVICSEGADTMMFWTFAPYLFKVLMERGMDEKNAISRILSWSRDGSSTETAAVTHGYAAASWTSLHLKGLEGFFSRVWVLDSNPNHISHQFTEQEARRIADLLMRE